MPHIRSWIVGFYFFPIIKTLWIIVYCAETWNSFRHGWGTRDVPAPSPVLSAVPTKIPCIPLANYGHSGKMKQHFPAPRLRFSFYQWYPRHCISFTGWLAKPSTFPKHLWTRSTWTPYTKEWIFCRIHEQKNFAVFCTFVFGIYSIFSLGNTYKKIVEERHVISALLPETNGIRTTWERLMFNMRMLLRLSSAKEFASDGLGLSRLREHCSEAYQNFEVFLNPNPSI